MGILAGVVMVVALLGSIKSGDDRAACRRFREACRETVEDVRMMRNGMIRAQNQGRHMTRRLRVGSKDRTLIALETEER